MKMKRTQRTRVRCWLLCIIPLSLPLLCTAQPVQLFLEDQTVLPNQEIVLDVKVANYDSIVATSFALRWDTLAFDYVKVSGLAAALALTEEDHFGRTMTDSGLLTLVYYDPTFTGVSLSDGAVLFKLHLLTKAQPGVITQVNFVDPDPLSPMEVVKAANLNAAVPVAVEGATITVGGGTPTRDADLMGGFRIERIFPNPLVTEALLDYYLPRSASVTLHIYDAAGRLVHQGRESRPAGAQQTKITAGQLSAPGAYLLKLSAGRETLSRSFIFVGQ